MAHGHSSTGAPEIGSDAEEPDMSPGPLAALAALAVLLPAASAGAEPVALAGARRTIEGNDDLILFTEVSPAHLASRGGTDAYLRTLADAGFELWQLEGDRVARRTVADLAHLSIGSDTDHADLVCAKGPAARARLAAAVARRPRTEDERG